jgi:hypothetical protein
MEDINKKCEEYINAYSKLDLDKITINDDAPMNDNIFLEKINNANKLIFEILNNDKINIIAKAELINKDRELYQNYIDDYKENTNITHKILIQKTIIELAKRQLYVLIEGLCAKCKNDKLMIFTCRNYIDEYNNLNFVKFANNITEYNNNEFNQDLQITYKLIKKINDENKNIFVDLINIDNQILKFFETNNTESQNLIIRKETIFLMINQLYTILRILCNICKEKLKYHFHLNFDYILGEIRKPFSSLSSSLQTVACMREQCLKKIYNAITKGKENGEKLDADSNKYLYYILTQKFNKEGQSVDGITIGGKQIFLRKLFMDWLYERLINDDFNEKEKKIIFCLFTDQQMKEFWGDFYKIYGIEEKYINQLHDEFVIEKLKSTDITLRNILRNTKINQEIKILEGLHNKKFEIIVNFFNEKFGNLNIGNTRAVLGEMEEIGSILHCHKNEQNLIKKINDITIANTDRINLYRHIYNKSKFKGGNLENMNYSPELFYIKKLLYKLSKKMHLLTKKF